MIAAPRAWAPMVAALAACAQVASPPADIEGVALEGVAGGPAIALGDAHTTVELFDAEQNRWIWMDPMIGVLGASLPGLGPLHVSDFLRFMGDPNLAQKIEIEALDEALSGPPSGVLLDFTRRGQRLVFATRAP